MTYPLRHERESHDERANVVGRALGREHKGDRAPTKRVEDDEEVHADNREDGIAVQRASRWVHSLVDANVEHGERLACRANQQRPLHMVSKRREEVSVVVHTLRPSCSVKAIRPMAVTTILTIPYTPVAKSPAEPPVRPICLKI